MRTLVGVARAHADVPDVARLHNVVEGLHLHFGQRLVVICEPGRRLRTVSSIGVS